MKIRITERQIMLFLANVYVALAIYAHVSNRPGLSAVLWITSVLYTLGFHWSKKE